LPARRPPRSKGKSRAEYEDESQEHSEMYAVLNLDKDASTEDVLRAYRTLAVAFQ
jgi:DnaJ-class molecular chaperone